MNQPAVNPYLRTKVLTASPEELRLMLYDGALKFCRQGRAAVEADKFEDSYNNLSRAQKIVLELSTSLKHSVEPELCGRLSALYTYIYRRLIDANMNRDVEAIDEAIKLLDYERETWQMLMNKLDQEGNPRRSASSPAAAQAAAPVAAAPAQAPRLSMPGAPTPYGSYSRSA